MDAADPQRYGDEFAPYLKGASGQYIYALRREAYAAHLPHFGVLAAAPGERVAGQLRLTNLPTR
jgi:hypothetical protein